MIRSNSKVEPLPLCTQTNILLIYFNNSNKAIIYIERLVLAYRDSFCNIYCRITPIY